ncbi:hypothetical protein [Acaryochloris marina]|uniref:hypothetical protein n=1 Tax=Acaryochloris marina TaxID=155978 RepID=UPI0005A0C87D|nr:hypothetical protein [Acaryochloris marina]BDM82032.1 hypothetical protein AM10699_48960 [Acaryochloris marina MBIC10699]
MIRTKKTTRLFIFLDLLKIIILSFNNPLKPKSFLRYPANNDKSLTTKVVDSFHVHEGTDKEFIEHLKGQVETLEKQVELLQDKILNPTAINLSPSYQVMLVVCALLMIAAFVGAWWSAYYFKEPLAYNEKNFIDLCEKLSISLAGGFIGIVVGKYSK